MHIEEIRRPQVPFQSFTYPMRLAWKDSAWTIELGLGPQGPHGYHGASVG